PKPCNKVALKLVACSMYWLADTTAVFYAFCAFLITVSAFSLNSVSIPPNDCSNLAPSATPPAIAAVIAEPIAAPPATATVFKLPISELPSELPSDLPLDFTSPPIDCSIIPLIPFAEGTICTYALPNSVAIFTLLPEFLTQFPCAFFQSPQQS